MNMNALCEKCEKLLTLDWNPYGACVDSYTCSNCFEPTDEQLQADGT